MIMMVYLLIFHDTAVRNLTIRIRQIFIVIPLCIFIKFGSTLWYGYGIFVLIYRSIVNTFVRIKSSVWIWHTRIDIPFFSLHIRSDRIFGMDTATARIFSMDTA